jgi:hypothetical protein
MPVDLTAARGWVLAAIEALDTDHAPQMHLHLLMRLASYRHDIKALLTAAPMTAAEAEDRSAEIQCDLGFALSGVRGGMSGTEWAHLSRVTTAALLSAQNRGYLAGLEREAELEAEVVRLKGLAMELVGPDALAREEDRSW